MTRALRCRTVLRNCILRCKDALLHELCRAEAIGTHQSSSVRPHGSPAIAPCWDTVVIRDSTALQRISGKWLCEMHVRRRFCGARICRSVLRNCILRCKAAILSRINKTIGTAKASLHALVPKMMKLLVQPFVVWASTVCFPRRLVGAWSLQFVKLSRLVSFSKFQKQHETLGYFLYLYVAFLENHYIFWTKIPSFMFWKLLSVTWKVHKLLRPVSVSIWYLQWVWVCTIWLWT